MELVLSLTRVATAAAAADGVTTGEGCLLLALLLSLLAVGSLLSSAAIDCSPRTQAAAFGPVPRALLAGKLHCCCYCSWVPVSSTGAAAPCSLWLFTRLLLLPMPADSAVAAAACADAATIFFSMKVTILSALLTSCKQ